MWKVYYLIPPTSCPHHDELHDDDDVGGSGR
jgi:hypothetical protein